MKFLDSILFATALGTLASVIASVASAQLAIAPEANDGSAGAAPAAGAARLDPPRTSSPAPRAAEVAPEQRVPGAPTSALPPPPYVQTGAGGSAATAPGTTTTGATEMRTAPDATATGAARPGAKASAVSETLGSIRPGHATGLSDAASVGTNSSVTIDNATTLHHIQNARFGARDELTARLGAGIDASQRSLALLRDQLNARGARPNAEFQHALNEVGARERTLRSSLQTTSRVADEAAWAAAQSALARDYQAYVEAVARTEAAAQGSVSGTGTRAP